MSDPRTDDPTASGLESSGFDKGTGDPNDDRSFLNDLPPAQVQDDDENADADADVDSDSDETDADA